MSAPVTGNTVIAGKSLVPDNVQHTELIGECPCLCLVNPHQRGMDYELLVHSKVQGDVQGLDKGIAAVWITAEIGLRDSGHYMVYPMLPGHDSRYTQEKQVPSRDKSVGARIFWLLLVHGHGRVRQGIPAELSDERHVHKMEVHACLFRQLPGHFHFKAMLLSVNECQGMDLTEFLLRPEQACTGVLAAAEYDQSFIIVHLIHYCMSVILNGL